ncbi:MAG: efflux RND transporter periplasmic adaptor subunit [Bacteroidetes bacterium]|nr:efflux RND transporter periplasmic adaptor subunit [Bacteroidota bacterium]
MKTCIKYLLAVILGLFLNGCKLDPKPDDALKTFVLSDTMYKRITINKSVYKKLKNELQLFGKISADFNKMIEVFPIAGGNVITVHVELGDFVTKGQLLATIRSTEVAAFEQELLEAKSDLIVAKNNLRVAQELFSGNLNTDRDVTEAESQLEKAEAHYRKITEIYKIYNLKSGSTFEVRSPITGFVIQKNINQDMLLRSDRSDNIFDIAQIDDVWALANVNESDINLVKLGVPAIVTTISYPDKKFIGKVDKIFNVIDPETKAMKIKIVLNNKDLYLKPEMRANIKLEFVENDSMVSIPSSALIFDKNKYFVMVYKSKSSIETRQVEVYRSLDDVAYIKNGLSSNESVITNGQLLIYDALND